ncbi:MAG: hypothetical protein K2M75_05370 [Clostridia bacterium]|nr:hypothetical protein [Clostridia bacterium]
MAQEKKNNPHQGHRERVKEKIKNQGIAYLPDHEVLEYLLYPFIPYKDTNPIAHDLIDKFGSLENVFDASPKVLLDVKNMTDNAALFLNVLPQIIKRYNLQKFGPKPMLDTVAHAVEYFQQLFLNEKEEAMYMLILNAKGMLLSSCKIGVGNIDTCQLNTREFIMRTADSQGNCIMLAHNHPSGNPLPSFDDCEFTRWLISAAEVLGIVVIDHIIIASEGYYSFRENDRLSDYVGVFKKYMDNAKASDKYAMKVRKFTDKK